MGDMRRVPPAAAELGAAVMVAEKIANSSAWVWPGSESAYIDVVWGYVWMGACNIYRLENRIGDVPVITVILFGATLFVEESFGRLGLIICVTSSHEPISCPLFYTSRSTNISLPNMSYKAGIVKAISELKERNGSSSIAIKKHMQVRGQYLLVNTTPLFLFVVVNLIPRLCRCRFDLLEHRQTCPQTRSG